MTDSEPQPEREDLNDEASADSSTTEEDTSFLDRDIGGRPMVVYLAILTGAIVLLGLLAVVWLSSRDDGPDPPLCLDIDPQQAETAIMAGEVDRVNVLVDSDSPLTGLTALQLELENGECRDLPKGADNRDGLYQVLGVVTLYNEEGNEQIRVDYQRREVPSELLRTSTPVPTMTTIPTETPIPEPTGTLTPTPLATRTVAPSPTVPPASPSPEARGSPFASPIASPDS